jgi:hypothetical protein
MCIPHPADSTMHEIMTDWTAIGKIQLMNSMQTNQVEAKSIGEKARLYIPVASTNNL